MTNDSWFASGGKLGVLGGGQLGKMLIEEAVRMDISLAVMDENPQCACAGITPYFQTGSITDFQNVLEFGRSCDVLTIEIENVNIEALKQLENEGVKVFPPPSVIELIQDKGTQKLFYNQKSIPTAPFKMFFNTEELNAAIAAGKIKFPFVWKARKGGYDGRGVKIIKNQGDLETLANTSCFVEDLIPFEKELACVGARSSLGEVITYPTVAMDFHPDANQVEDVFMPSGISEALELEAKRITVRLMNELNHVGLLAVEFFLTQDLQLLVNECAPRPHNSGHIFSDNCYISQFEQHLRAICGWALGSTRMICPGVMVNLVGDEKHSGKVYYEGASQAIKEEGVVLHLYGKTETRPFRKMGHINCIASTLEEAMQKAAKVRSTVKIISSNE